MTVYIINAEYWQNDERIEMTYILTMYGDIASLLYDSGPKFIIERSAGDLNPFIGQLRDDLQSWAAYVALRKILP